MKLRMLRTVLMISSLFCLAGYSQTKQPVSPTEENTVLKEVYKDAFLIGTSVNTGIITGRDKLSQDIAIRHFNAITPEMS